MFKHEGSELSFGSVTRENSGKYTCTATNDIGDGDRTDFDIDVMCKSIEVFTCFGLRIDNSGRSVICLK